MSGLARLAACIAFAVVAADALAQPYPARTVRIVNGFPAGGPTDILARILAERHRSAR
jgi:tripartite-type tricarboxylate transporter receptor subunit TctC